MTKVIVKSFLNGIEVSCGVYCNENKVKTLPLQKLKVKMISLITKQNMKGKSKETTPARISKELTLEIQKIAEDVYKKI